MRLAHDQELDAPVEAVWAHFMDLRRIGRCFPGARVTKVHGDDFVGEIRAKLGPLSMYFDGTGSMTER
ncbi:MAG: carbon monoxide dehydrogenase, partial [Dermatophilaceae bacterium]|nr:carbon monoxide dehydrogenase [Dermatophilaceae bacterium]